MSTYKENPAIMHMLIKAETLIAHFAATASELALKITNVYVDDFESNPLFGKYLINAYENDYSELNQNELFSILLKYSTTEELKDTVEAFFLCKEHAGFVLNFFYNFYLEGEKSLGFGDEYVNVSENVESLEDDVENIFVELFGDILSKVYEAKFGGARC